MKKYKVIVPALTLLLITGCNKNVYITTSNPITVENVSHEDSVEKTSIEETETFWEYDDAINDLLINYNKTAKYPVTVEQVSPGHGNHLKAVALTFDNCTIKIYDNLNTFSGNSYWIVDCFSKSFSDEAVNMVFYEIINTIQATNHKALDEAISEAIEKDSAKLGENILVYRQNTDIDRLSIQIFVN